MSPAASYSRSVKHVSRCAGPSPRVYYSPMWMTLSLLALLVASSPARVLAQIEITLAPSMVKGPSGAPVTTVEFSDYQ
jgi:hypothetical protein